MHLRPPYTMKSSGESQTNHNQFPTVMYTLHYCSENLDKRGNRAIELEALMAALSLQKIHTIFRKYQIRGYFLCKAQIQAEKMKRGA